MCKEKGSQYGKRNYDQKTAKKYGFKKGDKFMVKRSIMNECVVIIPDEKTPNIILSEKKLKWYGKLEGTPQLCCH